VGGWVRKDPLKNYGISQVGWSGSYCYLTCGHYSITRYQKMVIEQLRCDLTLRHPLDAGRNF
jgi:hypothetical protein